MTLPVNYPLDEIYLNEGTTSIATTPVAMQFISPVNGYLVRGYVGSTGVTTGTITVAVKINGGSDVFNSTLTLAAGTGPANNPGVTIPLVGAGTTSGVVVSEGDVIVATPSGGTGSTIGGTVTLVIRKDN